MTKEEQWKREAEIKLDEIDDWGFDFDNWSISDAYERGYCDSAEPREKRIEELEETNADLKQSLDWANEREHDDYVKIQELERQVKDLEWQLQEIAKDNENYQKENAEVKKKCENLQKYLDTQNSYRECAETWQKLAQAKEIIKDLLLMAQVEHLKERYESVEDAEQFLEKVK